MTARDHREALEELAAGLRDLHQSLLEEQRRAYERERGPILGGAHVLHLVAHDPDFAWLRVLSVLMVDLDALIDDDEDPSDDEAAALRQELEETLSPANPDDFWQRCAPLLQVPAVAIAYGAVRSALSRLPRGTPSDPAEYLHARHRWAVARRKGGRI